MSSLPSLSRPTFVCSSYQPLSWRTDKKRVVLQSPSPPPQQKQPHSTSTSTSCPFFSLSSWQIPIDEWFCVASCTLTKQMTFENSYSVLVRRFFALGAMAQHPTLLLPTLFWELSSSFARILFDTPTMSALLLFALGFTSMMTQNHQILASDMFLLVSVSGRRTVEAADYEVDTEGFSFFLLHHSMNLLTVFSQIICISKVIGVGFFPR